MKALLVDDHPLFLQGLSLLLEHDFDAVQALQAHSVAEAERALQRDPSIALVLLDLGLPDSEGTEGLKHLRERHPEPTYVVMSADERPQTILGAIELGAAGYLPKTTHTDVLRTALHTLMEGGVYLPSSALAMAGASDLIGAPASSRICTPEELGLSARQAEVLALLMEGKSNKLICRALDLGEATVKTHLGAVFRRLGVNSRTQAVVEAARLGLRLPHRW